MNSNINIKTYSYSFIIRIILHILVFVINKIYNIPLVLHFILLIIIDGIDYYHIPYFITKNKFFFSDNLINFLKKYNIRFYYDITDKFCDIISYVLFLNLLNLNIDKKFYNYIILYRLIGVFSLLFNKKYHNLIYFPDLFKELIGYEIFIGNNIYIKILIVILKTIFEYIKVKYLDKNIK